MRTARELLLLLPPLWSLLVVACSDPAPSELMPIVSRDEWKARSPLAKADIHTLPLKLVIIHDTKTAECSALDECAAVTRSIQDYHMDVNGWLDIGYNFLVGGDGSALEGRGWDSVGAFLTGWNKKALGIALIGNYVQAATTDAQMASALELIKQGVALGKVSADYKVVAACELAWTSSPGKAALSLLKKWDHWWDTGNKDHCQ